MGRKIFISYKYHDARVFELPETGDETTARHYVDALQALLDANDHINKGEQDNESLRGLSEDEIENRLRDKIFDSTVTIVLFSPGMREENAAERDQWIPWEISYSLKSKTRDGVTRTPNALLGVVLPQEKTGSYDYHLREGACATCNCRTITRTSMFEILKGNLFNAKDLQLAERCADHTGPSAVYAGNHSYMELVSWAALIKDVNSCISRAVANNKRWDDYNVVVTT